MNKLFIFILVIFFTSCSKVEKEESYPYNEISKNILDYRITPKSKFDKSGLMFSDQGAWFAYSLPDSANIIGFSGPFLLTQQNGVWASRALTEIEIKNVEWKNHETNSYSSHLEQIFSNEKLELKQQLVFLSGHTALIKIVLKNKSKQKVNVEYQWKTNPILSDNLQLSSSGKELKIISSKSEAIGHVNFLSEIEKQENGIFAGSIQSQSLENEETIEWIVSQTFIFPEYDWNEEKQKIQETNFENILKERKRQKNQQLQQLILNKKDVFKDSIYSTVLAKAQLTLQNNWRIPAGELTFEGMFPSYHYKWFNGFWSWDTWKQAVGTSFFDTWLAKEQMKQLFYFQKEDGFVPDVVYRDTEIEAHNLRDTKPPLSAWAVYEIYKKNKDIDFVKHLYPKLKKYHYWWYKKRDHDQDGLCEYGSTDGTLIAAKWESGMDNAIRFDNSKIVKNGEGAYSLNQESVDLNAYLYAEKIYLAELSKILQNQDFKVFSRGALLLREKIQHQFFDSKDGWFYDTNLEGNQFIKGEGSEGWTALWAKVATQKQAEAVKKRMMNPKKFYTKVPFQTMSADHPKFDPLNGYWRGPNWLDQSYFGVKSLRNYGFQKEADEATYQVLKGAEGILEKGKSIRENYHPLTGKGLHAKNFSWSAAHIIMLLSKE